MRARRDLFSCQDYLADLQNAEIAANSERVDAGNFLQQVLLTGLADLMDFNPVPNHEFQPPATQSPACISFSPLNTGKSVAW